MLFGENNIFILAFCLPLWIQSNSSFAQQEKITTINVANVEVAYVDRPGDLYLKLNDNTLLKFDTLGNLLYKKKLEDFTVFDPRDGARMFQYQKTKGVFSFYSEETSQEFHIEQQYALEPVLACASGDHNIWLLDWSDVSIKKINPAQSKVLVESLIDRKQFTKPLDIIAMREYQNFLFVHEKSSGILIFNSLGIQIKKIADKEIEWFNFLGEELYYKKKDKLIFHDLFDTSMREEPADPLCTFALLTDRRKYLIYPAKVDIFKNR
jgi:hypothetical protein